jgi:hypothetical protein
VIDTTNSKGEVSRLEEIPCLLVSLSSQALNLPARFLLHDKIKVKKKIVLFTTLTSIPACRKTLCAEKNDRYFDLEHLKICIYLNISYIFSYIVFHSHSRTP